MLTPTGAELYVGFGKPAAGDPSKTRYAVMATVATVATVTRGANARAKIMSVAPTPAPEKSARTPSPALRWKGPEIPRAGRSTIKPVSAVVITVVVSPGTAR